MQQTLQKTTTLDTENNNVTLSVHRFEKKTWFDGSSAIASVYIAIASEKFFAWETDAEIRKTTNIEKTRHK